MKQKLLFLISILKTIYMGWCGRSLYASKVTYDIIYSKDDPNSDWLKAHA